MPSRPGGRLPITLLTLHGERPATLSLERLIELKLASGMSALHRLKDLADVLEVIRIRQLPAEFVDGLDPWVRDKFRELWDAAQADDPHNP